MKLIFYAAGRRRHTINLRKNVINISSTVQEKNQYESRSYGNVCPNRKRKLSIQCRDADEMLSSQSIDKWMSDGYREVCNRVERPPHELKSIALTQVSTKLNVVWVTQRIVVCIFSASFVCEANHAQVWKRAKFNHAISRFGLKGWRSLSHITSTFQAMLLSHFSSELLS